MKTKTMIIVGVIVLMLAIAAYFVMKNKTGATTTTADASALGKKKNGSAYFQTDLDLTVKSIKGSPTWLADVQKKATAAGRSIDEQLKMEAKWMLENV